MLTNEQIQAMIDNRCRGWIARDNWGPKCAGCADEEFRIDGYCSIECRDYHDDEDVEALARELLTARAALDASKDAIARLVGCWDVYNANRGTQVAGECWRDMEATVRWFKENCPPEEQRGWPAVVHALNTKNDELKAALDAAQWDRDHWKANHDEMVARNQLLRDRPDLTAEQVAERLGWKAKLDAAGVELAGMREFVRTLLRSEGWDDPSRDGVDHRGPMPSWVKPARMILSASALRPGSHGGGDKT